MLTLNRRQFIFASIAACAASPHLTLRAWGRLPAPRRQFANVPLKSVKLREGVWAILERGGNSMLAETKEGPVLVDTKLVSSGQLLANESKRVAGMPTIVINTHHHYDHTGGNSAFDDASEIIAHRNLNPRMQAVLDNELKPALATEINSLHTSGKEEEAVAMAAWAEKITLDDLKADREFDESLELSRGETKFSLHHFGNGHTDNDTVVHMPDANVIHMGDLFFNKCHPYIDRPAGANTVGWRAAVRQALELSDDKTIIIPGHGEITDKAGLATQVAYFDQLQSIVEKAMKDGRGKATIGKLEPEQFNGYGFEMLREQALIAMYDELASGMN